MPDFNLVTDPWIPVRWKSPGAGQPLVSLRDAFAEAKAIADLSCHPAERVSLVRLLVCAAQAALGAPPHSEAWAGFGDDLASAVYAYLDRPEIRDRFELFGEGPRFLQTRVPPKSEPVPASKLFPHLATGNNPTLFDHGGGSARTSPPAELALALVTFQNFYPLYGAGYKGKGPCVDGNMLHVVLQGESLGETILRNCLDEEAILSNFPSGFGQPIWETLESNSSFAKNATETYLGRLVPRHRNLRLADYGGVFHLDQKSLIYPGYDAAIEPSATIVVRTKGNDEYRALLPARLDRAAWRDLHQLCALRVASGEKRGDAPLVVKSHLDELLGSEGPGVRLWTGALVTDLKAKILDTVESVHTVPARMLETYDGQRDYAEGVEFAEGRSKRLFFAVKTYSATMKHESAPIETAHRAYWHALDRDADILLRLVAESATRNADETNPWGRAVRSALVAAYNLVCPRQTPRQHEAYAAGWRELSSKPKSATKRRIAAA